MFYFLVTIFFLFIFSVDRVQAEPVYLKCHLFSSSGFVTSTPGVTTNEIIYDITLDEANQQVSFSFADTGYTQKMSGVFSADKVSFGSPSTFDGRLTINRVDLSFQREVDISVTKGKCSSVEKPKNRKF